MIEKHLNKLVPEGTVVTNEYLLKNGVSRSAKDYYLRSGKLESFYRGVYRKPGPKLKWENIVYSLRMMDYAVHVGGLSALNKHGFSHYIKFSNEDSVFLYRDDDKKLPNWVDKIVLKNDVNIKIMSKNPFPTNFRKGIIYISFGLWDWSIPYSSAERALLEFLNKTSDKTDFEVANELFESAVNLKPKLVQTLLENCLFVKSKRLFLWFAKKHNHQWFSELETDKINLGKGKLHIVSGGVYNNEYKITVPKDMDAGQVEPLF